MQEHARRIARVSAECKMENVDEERYLNKFRSTAMKEVHLWCSGMSFSEIMKDTKLFEGMFESYLNSDESFFLFRLDYSHNATIGGIAKRHEECSACDW